MIEKPLLVIPTDPENVVVACVVSAFWLYVFCVIKIKKNNVINSFKMFIFKVLINKIG
jgi:hypothetical protein